MANNGERRMLFDIRGRRKHVVRFVYAILAFLMAGSLFFVVGPVNLGGLLGGGSSGAGNGASQYEEEAQTFERKLRRDPKATGLLVGATRARVNASRSLYKLGPEGQPEVTEEALEQLQLANEAWDRYKKAVKEPAVGLAELMAGSLLVLAQYGGSIPESEEKLRAAADAQGIVAAKRPNLNSLTTLAYYLSFTEPKQAKQVGTRAERYTHSKAERDSVRTKVREFLKTGKKFREYAKKAKKAEAKAGKERKGRLFESPLGGSGVPGTSVP